MRQKMMLLAVGTAAVAVGAADALAHCQIPCGIYDDPARFTAMEEHVTTIEKSMKQIEELSRAQPLDYNQIVRWVANKEAHADKLTEIVTFYFMAQRVKPTDPQDKATFSKYLRELTCLHEIVVHAMKAKQTTDVAHCAELRSLIAKFKASYLGAQAQSAPPTHEHHSQASHSYPHP